MILKRPPGWPRMTWMNYIDIGHKPYWPLSTCFWSNRAPFRLAASVLWCWSWEREGEQFKWSLAFTLYIESFPCAQLPGPVHTARFVRFQKTVVLNIYNFSWLYPVFDMLYWFYYFVIKKYKLCIKSQVLNSVWFMQCFFWYCVNVIV